MLSSKFGIELELTGITRAQAARVVARTLHITIERHALFRPAHLIFYTLTDNKGRKWKITFDTSLICEKKNNGHIVPANDRYSVELVTPAITYDEDVDTLLKVVYEIKQAGGFVNESCGIHIHLDGHEHTPTSLRNFINLIASRNDLFYKALQIHPKRMDYCKKMDEYLVRRMNRRKVNTFQQMESVWYDGYKGNRQLHYHRSRYHFLNLHSFFHGNQTIELRGFNSTLSPEVIRAYIVFALAINHQALTQKSARYHKVQSENEKYAMRSFLVQIGLSGTEYKSCRNCLYRHLSGNAAWRYGKKKEKQNNLP